jgi:hypothetical protein
VTDQDELPPAAMFLIGVLVGAAFLSVFWAASHVL